MNKPLFIETIKVENGVFIRLEDHLQRIRQTQREMFGVYSPVAPEAWNIPADMRCGNVKCRIVYSQTIQEPKFTAYIPRCVESLRLVEADDSIDYHLKYADRCVLDNLCRQRSSENDVLIMHRGMITDTSYSNIVFTAGNEYVTPDTYLLNGTRRQQLLNCGKIHTARLTLANIGSFERAILINTMLGIEDGISIPVSQIKGL